MRHSIPLRFSALPSIISLAFVACSGQPPEPTCQTGNLGGTSGTDPCATGGATTTGGSISTGGVVGSGGFTSTGGSLTTGGAPATGGLPGSGGAASGGAATGGNDTGGAATGGAATGGAATGGSDTGGAPTGGADTGGAATGGAATGGAATGGTATGGAATGGAACVAPVVDPCPCTAGFDCYRGSCRSTTRALSTPVDFTLSKAYSPSVAVADDGTAAVAFYRYVGSSTELYVSWLSPGATTWEGPERLSTNYATSDPPHVVADLCGRIVVMWPEGTSYTAKVALRHQGAWQTSVLAAASSSWQFLGMDGAGRIVAMLYGTYHELARGETSWSGPITSPIGTAFAIAPNGDMAVGNSVSGGSGVYATVRRYRRSTNAWLAQEFISAELPQPTNGMYRPTLTYDALGQLHALFRLPTTDPQITDLHYWRFSEGSGWSSDERVENVDLTVSNVGLGATDTGIPVAAWGYSPAGDGDVRLAYRVTDWNNSIVLAPAPMPMVVWGMAVDPLGHTIVTVDNGYNSGRIDLVHPDGTTQLLNVGGWSRANVATNGRGDFLLAWEVPGATAIRVAWYR